MGGLDSIGSAGVVGDDRASREHTPPGMPGLFARSKLLERSHRQLVMNFSGSSAILGLLMLPLFLFDVFDLRAVASVPGLVIAIAVVSAAQALVWAWVRSGGDVQAAGIAAAGIQTVSCIGAALLLRDNAMLCLAALMFTIVPIMLAGSVLDPFPVKVTAGVICVVTGAVAVTLFPQHGWLIVVPPVLVVDVGTYIIHTTANVAHALDVRNAEHRVEERRLELASWTDSLTGLLNRRGFFLAAEKELDLARRQGVGVTLTYLDLDGMKEINDSFGHLRGDEALQRAASLLRDVLRSSDLMARIGGDEFAILAWQTPGAGMTNFPKRLDDVMARRNAENPLTPPVWLSYGMVNSPMGDERSFEELLREADGLMYEAKVTNRFARGGSA